MNTSDIEQSRGKKQTQKRCTCAQCTYNEADRGERKKKREKTEYTHWTVCEIKKAECEDERMNGSKKRNTKKTSNKNA